MVKNAKRIIYSKNVRLLYYYAPMTRYFLFLSSMGTLGNRILLRSTDKKKTYK